MNQVLAIAWLRIKSVFRDKKSYLWFVGLPIIFTMIFGSMMGSGEERRLPPVGLIVENQSDMWIEAGFSVQQLQNSQDFNWVEGERENLIELVKNGKLIAVVEMRDDGFAILKRFNFAEHIQLENLIRQNVAEQAALQTYISDEAQRQRVQEAWNQLDIVYKWEPLSVVEDNAATTEMVGTETVDYSQGTMAIGFAIMFLMINIVIGAGIVLIEKGQGTWNRMLMAPIKPSQMFIGYGLGYVAIGWLQFLILMVVSTVLFDVQWGNFFSFVVITTLFLVAIVSFGLLLSQLVKSFKQQQAVGSLLVTATSMLSGVFWPLEFVPEVMRTIAKGIPQYWAMEGLKSAMYLNKGITELLEPIMALGLFTLIFYGVWLVLYKFSIRAS